MTDFPRGWTYSGVTSGAADSITVPAIAGVVHVLDSVYWRFQSAAAAGPYEVTLTSSDGTFAGLVLGLPYLAGGGTDEGTLSGLDLAAGPGASLTVAFTGSVAGVDELLVLQGHDI